MEPRDLLCCPSRKVHLDACIEITKLFLFAGAFHIAIDGELPILPVVISEYDFLDSRY